MAGFMGNATRETRTHQVTKVQDAIDWFFKIIRIAGVNFPVAAAFVQLQAELESDKIADRLKKLEDPISFIHEDVPSLSREIYQTQASQDSESLSFNDEFYEKYRRPLAALNQRGFISISEALGVKVPLGIRVTDPSYMLYMCALFEDKTKMENLIDQVDSCRPDKWLDGEFIKDEMGLPKSVVRAVFKIYEAKGYGLLSNTIGTCEYMGKA